MLLNQLASESGRGELIDAPLLFWGHSGGVQFGSTFAALRPERTIGFVAYQGWGVSPADVKILSRIPALFSVIAKAEFRQWLAVEIRGGAADRSARRGRLPHSGTHHTATSTI
jgi:pimeloyl-ACP methyl ester carboxylesterase